MICSIYFWLISMDALDDFDFDEDFGLAKSFSTQPMF